LLGFNLIIRIDIFYFNSSETYSLAIQKVCMKMNLSIENTDHI
jgi:hypothetical protein